MWYPVLDRITGQLLEVGLGESSATDVVKEEDEVLAGMGGCLHLKEGGVLINTFSGSSWISTSRVKSS
jgi:hypothetical protein